MKHLPTLAIALLGLGLFGCNSTEVPVEIPATIEPTTVTNFTFKHMHFSTSSMKADMRADLPESLVVRLNSIPGKFGGFVQNEDEFVRRMASNAVLRVNWDSLILGGHLGSPAIYSDSQPFKSLSPASVRMMRIGTFIDAPDDEPIFPDSVVESFGFYSASENAQVNAVYFDAPIEGVSAKTLCDGTPIQADLKITKAGLYFLTSRFEGAKITYSLVTNPGDLVFAVFTHSQANLDFVTELRARMTCSGG